MHTTDAKNPETSTQDSNVSSAGTRTSTVARLKHPVDIAIVGAAPLDSSRRPCEMRGSIHCGAVINRFRWSLFSGLFRSPCGLNSLTSNANTQYPPDHGCIVPIQGVPYFWTHREVWREISPATNVTPFPVLSARTTCIQEKTAPNASQCLNCEKWRLRTSGKHVQAVMPLSNSARDVTISSVAVRRSSAISALHDGEHAIVGSGMRIGC